MCFFPQKSSCRNYAVWWFYWLGCIFYHFIWNSTLGSPLSRTKKIYKFKPIFAYISPDRQLIRVKHGLQIERAVLFTLEHTHFKWFESAALQKTMQLVNCIQLRINNDNDVAIGDAWNARQFMHWFALICHYIIQVERIKFEFELFKFKPIIEIKLTFDWIHWTPSHSILTQREITNFQLKAHCYCQMFQCVLWIVMLIILKNWFLMNNSEVTELHSARNVFNATNCAHKMDETKKSVVWQTSQTVEMRSLRSGSSFTWICRVKCTPIGVASQGVTVEFFCLFVHLLRS